ncbi:MAG: S41 family peptidase [Bacteroidota bacterium]
MKSPKRIIGTVVCFFLLTLGINAQSDIQLLRFPSISPDGNQVAFSYQGDIWTSNANGGTAMRMTIHESYESNPQWSPDGKNLLFQSNRYGNSDLYVMPTDGGAPERLTYFSGGDGAGKWMTNDQIVFSTRRAFAQVERESEVYQISRNGGTPNRILESVGNAPAVSPDGRYIAITKGNCRLTREAYRGPANRNIWVYDTQTKTFNQITTDEGQDALPEWGSNNELYFLSARTGRYNVYSAKIKNGKAEGDFKRVTNFKDEGIRNFDVSANGSKMVFERKSGIFTANTDGKGVKEIKVNLTKDYRFDPVEKMTLRSGASEYTVSPNGKYLAMVARGDIFTKPESNEKPRAVCLDDHTDRAQDIVYLNDTTLLFISDRNGNRDIFMLQSADEDEPNLFKTFKRSVKQLTNTSAEEGNLVLSPDGKKLAFTRGRGQFLVADIDSTGTLSNEKILQDGWDTPGGVSWSPDSKWLAYNMSDLDFNEEVYIHAADNSSPPVNVSMHPRSDFGAVWSKDGSKLGFLSNRNNSDNDVWFVWLKKSDWEKTRRDWEDDEEEEKKKDKKKGTEDIEIDFEDIYKRLQKVTNMPGNEGNVMVSNDGEKFFFTSNGGSRAGFEGNSSFYSIKWDGSELTELVRNRRVFGAQWDGSGKNIYYLASGRLNKLSVASKKSKTIPYEAKMKLDHMAERKQMFDDAWRAMNAGFYDPKFHGEDWEELRETYEDRTIAASTAQDFRDMFNAMLGQLNASHMGMSGRNPEDLQADRTGRIGVEIMPMDRGVKVVHVVPNTPADREASKIEENELILSVNGESIDRTVNFYSLLEGTTNEKVLLEVQNTAGETREMVIRPTFTIGRALYEEWVKKRQELTEKYSNGRLGYIHIQGMNWPSFERFERELTASGLGKEGIVIDVRYNGGGWTTDMLMTVLNVRQHSYTIPRGAAADLDRENKKFANNYPYGERVPFSSLTKPSVALCNHNSYSNAEIFSHAYKGLNHGTLVGEATFGAVISTGSYGLKDGSRIRMPFRAWYVKDTGKNMEHGPAVPDVEVFNAPDSKANGEDPQLKKAVEVLLGEIK